MKIKINGKIFNVLIEEVKSTGILFNINDKSYFVERSKEIPNTDNKTINNIKKANAISSSNVSDNNVTSPISGQLVEILVKEGELVEIGTPLFVVEAMKMQNKICSKTNGLIESLNLKVGDEVKEGEVILILKK